MSRSIRLFVTAPLAAGAEIAATPAQAHYLAGVMRARDGDALLLFNGRDGEWRARIATPRRGGALLVAENCLRPQVAGPALRLAFALLKRPATEFLVQKATELGATVLMPMQAARSVADRLNAARLRGIAIEAAEQCERLDVPTIDPPVPLGELLAGWPPALKLFAAIERLAVAPLAPGGGRPAGLLIGPEGGFTAAELDALRSCPFVVPISLGPRILRAETAAIAGLVLLQAPAACS